MRIRRTPTAYTVSAGDETRAQYVRRLLSETPEVSPVIAPARKETREEQETFRNGAGSNIFAYRGFDAQQPAVTRRPTIATHDYTPRDFREIREDIAAMVEQEYSARGAALAQATAEVFRLLAIHDEMTDDSDRRANAQRHASWVARAANH